jgi:hypothetical protein
MSAAGAMAIGSASVEMNLQNLKEVKIYQQFYLLGNLKSGKEGGLGGVEGTCRFRL